MKNVERKLAEEIVYSIGNKEELKVVKEKYNNYKKWVIKMNSKEINPSKLLKGLVDKIYKEYKNDNSRI